MSKVTTLAAKSTDASYKKSIVFVVVTLLLLIVASLLFYKVSRHNALALAFTQEKNIKDEPVSEANPEFVDLGTFTANISGADSGQHFQTSLSLKLTSPGLGERIKASSPEIKHRVNMLLQSKRASDLVSYEDKEKLALQIKAQIEYVMGFREAAPFIVAVPADAALIVPHNGISDVLFTSFLIEY